MFMEKKTKIKTGQISKKILMYLFITGAICIAASSPRFVSKVGQIIFKQKFYQKRKLLDAFQYLKRKELIDVKKRSHNFQIDLTAKGRERVDRYLIDDMVIQKPKKWDQRWRVVIFDIPQEQRVKRNAFQRKLKELGFFPLQKSVWLHPFECQKEIMILKNFFNLKQKEIKVLLVERIENDAFLKKIFGL